MKSIFEKMKGSGLFLFGLLLLCSLFGVHGTAMSADFGGGTPDPNYGDQILDENGVVMAGLIDLTQASTLAPELISKKFVQEVIRVDPYSYPTMALLKNNTHFRAKEKTNDHVIQINTATTPPVQITVATAVTATAVEQVAVNFGQGNKIIGLHQTIIFKDITGYEDDGVTSDGHWLQCRVVAKDSATGFPILKPTNGKLVTGVKTLPAIPVGTLALRGDRIGTETQIRTEQFGVAPSPTDYFVPKRLIEFGTSGWYDNASKMIKWGSAEIKEMAMTEFLRTSAPSFWVGKQVKAAFPEYKSNAMERTFYPEGLFYQAGRSIDLNGAVTVSALVNLEKIAFGENNSGPTKIFAMGNELAPLFQELILSTPGLNYSVYKNKTLDINFSQIVFAGGNTINFINDPSLNDCGLNDKGFLLDPKWAGVYAYGYEFIPLDGKKMQERDTKGLATIDESVNILLNKESHVVVSL